MHTPFSLHPLIPPDVLGSEAVTACLLHADRIVLGTEKGSLLVLDLDLRSASSSSAPPSATLVNRLEGFTKQGKAVDQLGVIRELNGLVCLSGGDVTLHSFSDDFPVLSSFSAQTKASCSLFSLSTSHRPSASSTLPQIHTTLALACRRRLLLLSWTDGTWNPLEEVSLPHQIRGMAFVAGGRRIVAGFSTGEYGGVSLPEVEGGKAELGELFHAPFPSASSVAAAHAAEAAKPGAAPKAGFGSLSGLGGLSSAALGGLSALPSLGVGGKKVEKNGVVAVPPPFRPRSKNAKGKGRGEVDVEEARRTEWLWGEQWGWEEGAEEEEVLVVRDNLALPLSPSGKPRPSQTPSSSRPSLAYPGAVEETVVLAPYVLSLIAPPPPTTASSAPAAASPGYALAIHALDSLAPAQVLSIPPRPVSPPSSIAESSASSSLSATLAGSKATPPPVANARLLTVSSSPPSANSSTSDTPPALLLTSTPATGSIAAGGGFASQTLYILAMSPWTSQVESLGAAGRWSEATSLLRRSASPLTAALSLPRPLLARLATLHVLSLWTTEKKYAAAVDAFIRLNVAPGRVVAVCEERVSGKLRRDEAGWEELFGGRRREEVEAARAKEREEKEKAEQQRAEAERLRESLASSSPAGKRAKGPLAAVEDDDAASIRSVGSGLGRLAGGLGRMARVREGSAAEEEEKAREEREKEEARATAAAEAASKRDLSARLDELIRYLTDRRQQYSLAFSLLPSPRPSPSSPLPPASADELLALPNVPLTQLSAEQLARTAQVVDTALFRAYLVTKPVMLGPMCRIENWCEVEEVEGLLMGAKKYRELLDLYNGKNMHEKAVQLLRQMSEEEDDPEERLAPTVRYLHKLGPQHVDVILEASKWVFEQDRVVGLTIFTADLEEVDSLPRRAVTAHLEQIGRDVCIKYLEHVIHDLGEDGAEFHEKLVELYLAEVLEEGGGKSRRTSPTYAALLALLESSTSYRADRMLGRLPSEDMSEVRAILLGRLGRHEGALQIYVYQLEDHETAEQYCKRLYDSTPSMRPSIFPLLLRLYLRPRPNHPLLFGPALSLLSTHAARIDPLEAFDLLPPLVAVGDIQTYLEKTLRRAGERRREAVMVKGVEKARLEADDREVVRLEERRVKITEGRVCPVCHKRIGNSVIAIHNPHGEVTHYQCREQFQEMRAR
ncbi:hypothetical protein JCM10213_004425 [Rhodosporidiobolus nylandii]